MMTSVLASFRRDPTSSPLRVKPWHAEMRFLCHPRGSSLADSRLLARAVSAVIWGDSNPLGDALLDRSGLANG